MKQQEQISQALAGNPVIARQLAEEALAFLMRYFLTSWRLSMEQAEEFTQEAFAEAWSSLKGFSGGSWHAWLGTIARRVAWKHLRNKAPTTSISDLDGEGEHEDTPLYDNHQRNQEEQTVTKQEWDVLRHLIKELRQEYQEILFLYYMEEMATDAIAKLMDIPLGTVKIWLHRARNELKKKWERINLQTQPRLHKNKKEAK